jgi:thiol-disulfide isomerase/thioredoxin
VFSSNRWLRRLESLSLLTLGLALNCPAALGQVQAPGSKLSSLEAAPEATAKPAAAPPRGGLNTVNPYAEDAETVAARYRVPDTDDVTKLMAYIIYVRSFEPRDTQTYLIHRKQMPIAVKAAAEKVLRLEKDNLIVDTDGVKVHTNAYHQADMLVLVAQVQMLADLPPAQQRDLFLSIRKRLDVTHPPQGDYLLAMQLATRLESAQNTPLAAEAYDSFAKAFAKSDNEEVLEMGRTFVAAARRMGLLGKPIEVVGRTIDGKAFDWKAYKGKVVLIDYWATWCEPCRREMPNVQNLYRLYHDRGFEVVGINVDESRVEAEAFVKQQGLPWANLFDTTSNGDHPMSSYYGIVGYPTVLLVGKDGNVVSLDARGDKLKELLAKMLGPSGETASGDNRNPRPNATPPAR